MHFLHFLLSLSLHSARSSVFFRALGRVIWRNRERDGLAELAVARQSVIDGPWQFWTVRSVIWRPWCGRSGTRVWARRRASRKMAERSRAGYLALLYLACLVAQAVRSNPVNLPLNRVSSRLLEKAWKGLNEHSPTHHLYAHGNLINAQELVSPRAHATSRDFHGESGYPGEHRENSDRPLLLFYFRCGYVGVTRAEPMS